RQRSHDIIDDMETCVIQDELGDRMVEAVRRIATELDISAYDEIKHEGILRHIVVRTAYETGDVMIILVTRTEKLPHQQELIEQLTDTYPAIKSIIQNVNEAKTNVILGKMAKTLYGDDYIIDTIGALKFAISAKSFYQVNPVQTKKLYDKALEVANVGTTNTLIAAYCDIGTISRFIAQSEKKVYGIEVVLEAIDNAKENAKLNHIENAEFVVGQAEKIMPWWSAQGLRPDVITVDPPRKGCDEALLKAMINMQPKRSVYVSCNPSTLARDLRILEDGGFKTQEVQPVDMFSQTMHVESVALLELV